MNITHNGKKYSIPASLGEIKLKQVIDFQNLYGRQIEEMQKTVDDELEKFQINLDLACKSVSFFSGIPLEEIYKTNIDHVVSIFSAVLSPIFIDQDERKLQENYFFKDALWQIASPELTFENSMTFNELILGKEIAKDLQQFSIGKYEALQKLLTIYFRKEDEDGNIEPFQEDWMSEESERMQMMLELPMDVVLDVAFFLQSSMGSWIKHFQYLENPEAEKDLT